MLLLENDLRARIDLAPQQYHRLIIILSSENRAADFKLMDIAGKMGLGYVNLGLALSQMLLDLTERQRALKLPQLVEQIVNGVQDIPILFDHIEILFEPVLKQDPLRLLQGLSRNKTILAMWNGQVINGYLTYAVPEHPEYRRYPVKDLNILSILDYAA